METPSDIVALTHGQLDQLKLLRHRLLATGIEPQIVAAPEPHASRGICILVVRRSDYEGALGALEAAWQEALPDAASRGEDVAEDGAPDSKGHDDEAQVCPACETAYTGLPAYCPECGIHLGTGGE